MARWKASRIYKQKPRQWVLTGSASKLVSVV
jgi:hypothetical protein